MNTLPKIAQEGEDTHSRKPKRNFPPQTLV
jgi:hypothetical protein